MVHRVAALKLHHSVSHSQSCLRLVGVCGSVLAHPSAHSVLEFKWEHSCHLRGMLMHVLSHNISYNILPADIFPSRFFFEEELLVSK